MTTSGMGSSPLFWLLLRTYRNVLRKRLASFRSPGKMFGLVAVLGLLALLGRQRTIAEHALERSLAQPPPGGGLGAATTGTSAGQELLGAIAAVRADPEAIGLALALLFACFTAVAWLNPIVENPLELTEAETAILLTGPLPRWQVVVYKVARWQLPLLLHSLALTAILAGTGDALGNLRRAFAFWILIASWRTHRGFAGILRAALHARGGIVLWTARALFTAAIVAVLALLWAHGQATPDADETLSLLRALPTMARDETLRLVLFPWLALTVPIARSGDAAAWAETLAPALAVLATTVLLVVRADAAYEQSAAAEGQRASRNGWTRRALWPLASIGSPALALVFRQLAPHLRLAALRRPLTIVAVVVLASYALPALELHDAEGFLTGLLATIGLLFVVPLAPLLVRLDIRREMERIDVLRALPLPTRQLLLALGGAEWLACLAVQTTALGLLLVNAALSPALARWVPLFLSAKLLVLPGTTAIAVALCQLGALSFPSWVTPATARGPRIDAVGGRLMTLLSFGFAMAFLLAAPLSAGSFLGHSFCASPRDPGYDALFLLGFYAVIGAEIVLFVGLSERAYDRLGDPTPPR
jgi:ABC-2 type transport system permease protein